MNLNIRNNIVYMNSELIATVIGYVLFAISEILPLINIPTNGIIQSFFLGVGNAFKNPEKNIELAQILIHSKPELGLANVVNTISSNPLVKSIIDDLLANPTNINNITAVQKQKEIASVVSILRNNTNIKEMVTKLLSDPNIYNNVSVLLSNPNLSHPSLMKGLSNSVITENPGLLDAFKVPGIADNIQQMLNNPQLSNIVNVLANDPNKLANINNIIKNTESQSNIIKISSEIK
jgi:hypothetical protein